MLLTSKLLNSSSNCGMKESWGGKNFQWAKSLSPTVDYFVLSIKYYYLNIILIHSANYQKCKEINSTVDRTTEKIRILHVENLQTKCDNCYVNKKSSRLNSLTKWLRTNQSEIYKL